MPLPTKQAALARIAASWSMELKASKRTALGKLLPRPQRGERSPTAEMLGWSVADTGRDYHLDVDLNPVMGDRFRVQIAYHRNPSSPPEWIITRSQELGGMDGFSRKISEILGKPTETIKAEVVVDFRFPRTSWRPVFRMPVAEEVAVAAADAMVSTVSLKLVSENEPVTVRLGVHEDAGEPNSHVTVRWSQKEIAIGDYSLAGEIPVLYDRAWGIGQRFVREEVDG